MPDSPSPDTRPPPPPTPFLPTDPPPAPRLAGAPPARSSRSQRRPPRPSPPPGAPLASAPRAERPHTPPRTVPALWPPRGRPSPPPPPSPPPSRRRPAAGPPASASPSGLADARLCGNFIRVHTTPSRRPLRLARARGRFGFGPARGGARHDAERRPNGATATPTTPPTKSNPLPPDRRRRLAAAAGVRKRSMSSAGKTERTGQAARAGTNLRRAYIRLARATIFFGDLRTVSHAPRPRRDPSHGLSVGRGKIQMCMAVDWIEPSNPPTDGRKGKMPRERAVTQAGRQAGRSHQSEAAALTMDQSVSQSAGACVCACSHPASPSASSRFIPY